MLASVQTILERVSEVDMETWLVQLQTLFETHFLPDTGSTTAHDPIAQHSLLSFSSEPINSSLVTDEMCVTEDKHTIDSDSQDEVYTTGTVNHIISCNEEEDATVTQTCSSETL